MTSLTIEQKRVDIYPSAKPGSPVIYLNTFSNAVNSVYKNLMALGCPDFCLVAVSQLKWDHDMTPWYMGPISKHDTPCTGQHHKLKEKMERNLFAGSFHCVKI